MARTSRKNISNANVQGNGSAAVLIQPERIFHAAAYIRLSVEDNHYSKDCESIEMQQYMVEKFIAEQPDMILYKAYVDNGETGTNFERPGFEEMMEDVRGRAVDCIVVKDLSRFGRNYVETGYYLEKIFPYLDVRFIALNDGYDTLKGDGNELVLSLKNLINDFYAKDISRKVKSALETKQKNGEFIGSITSYGYRKSPEDKHKLIPDPETAPVVREIFARRLNGEGYIHIARCLNERNVPSPSLWHYQNGDRQKQPIGNSRLWCDVTIKRLTENPVYIGHVAQRKREVSLSRGISQTQVSKDEWIVVKNTHEPIIDQETFDKVNQLGQQRKQDYKARIKPDTHTEENIFRGLLICKDCNAKMIRKIDKTAVRMMYTYECRTFRDNLEIGGCTRKRVGAEDLKDSVLEGLRIQINLALDLESLLNKMQKGTEYKGRQKEIKEKISNVHQRLKRNTMLKGTLFESYSDHILDMEEYRSMKARYDKEDEELKEQLAMLEQEEKEFSEFLSSCNTWIRELKKYRCVKVLTGELVREFVKCILISGYNEVEIVWNFHDEFAELSKRLGKGAE